MRSFLVLVIFATLLNTLPSWADELLANPTFAGGAKGWQLLNASVLPSIQRGASGVVQLEKPGDAGTSGGAVYTDVLQPPVGHELRFQVSTKGKGQLGINIAALNGEKDILASTHRDVPLTGKDWQPITEIFVAPSGAVKSYAWRMRPDGLNWLCDVSVSTGPKGAVIAYEALVLVGDRDPAMLLKTNTPEIPNAEVGQWTRSTACVQSVDPGIRKKAEELAQGTEDLEAYARKVIAFTRDNRGTGAPFTALDAKAGLACGGSCTNRANLAAALLRARGIPARTVAHLPTWSGPLYEHWLVEYWHPGTGWVWLESTLGKWQPRPWMVAVLNVATPEDEDRAFDPLHLRYVMPGAPHSAVIELSEAVWPASDLVKDDGTNIAEPVAPLVGSAEEMAALFQAARTAFPELAARCIKGVEPSDRFAHILVGATSGKSTELRAALAPKD